MMAIDVILSVQYNGGSLPDIILLAQGYCHYWRTHLNAMKRLYFVLLAYETTIYTCSRMSLRACR